MATATKLKFHLATPNDVAPLAALINAAFRSDTTTQVFLTSQRIDVTSEQGVADRLTIPNSALLVATTDNDNDDNGDATLVGTVGVRLLDADRAWLGMLAVDPARHNGRLGRQILEYTEDYARRRWGIKRMELDAVGTRKELIEWYERRGYVRTGGANPFPYGEGRDVSFLREGLDFKILGKDFDGPVVAGAAE